MRSVGVVSVQGVDDLILQAKREGKERVLRADALGKRARDERCAAQAQIADEAP